MAVVGGSELLNTYALQVLEVPAGLEDVDGSTLAFALIVLRRQTGALLALPVDVLSPDVLAQGLVEESEEGVGQSLQVLVAAGHVTEFQSTEQPQPEPGALVDVLLVDVPAQFRDNLIPLDPAIHPLDLLHAFHPDDPTLVPLAQDLVQQAWDWVRDPGAGQLLTFYSAEEGDAVPETPTPHPKRSARQRAVTPNGGGPGASNARGGDPPRRPRQTVASLATSMEQINSSLPAIMSQLESLTQRTLAMESQLQKDTSRPSMLQQPLGSSTTPGLGSNLASPAELLKQMPPPGTTAAGHSRRTEPRPFVSEASMLAEEKHLEGEPSDLARAVLVQSQAMAALVNQLASGDPLHDLGASSSSLSSKGAQGRQKLQQELASHRGVFFTSVIQAMARRMQPSKTAELTPAELAARGVIPTLYVERFGGYGRTRDLGCLMWQVAMLLDHLQSDNMGAAKDAAALLAVCLEQASLDGGKLDVGLLLSLSEDPPVGVFQNRSLTNYSKGRAFAPLAEQRWVTIALAYIKEMDLIASKRLDATGAKGDKESTLVPAIPKKAPKKAAKGGGKKGQQTQKEEEE
eukprot:s1075_g6.t1